jgi:hypothetical protein
MDMRFGTWNVRGIYRAGSLTTVAREVTKYKLGSVEVQEVRWDGVAINQETISIFTLKWQGESSIRDRTICRQRNRIAS